MSLGLPGVTTRKLGVGWTAGCTGFKDQHFASVEITAITRRALVIFESVACNFYTNAALPLGKYFNTSAQCT